NAGAGLARFIGPPTPAGKSRSTTSANPPAAPEPVTKNSTGRRPRGRPGHQARLKRRLLPQRLHTVVPFVPTRGDRCAGAKAATFCANVLGLVPALWRFVVSAGAEPTNNHAERLLRRGVR